MPDFAHRYFSYVLLAHTAPSLTIIASCFAHPRQLAMVASVSGRSTAGWRYTTWVTVLRSFCLVAVTSLVVPKRVITSPGTGYLRGSLMLTP